MNNKTLNILNQKIVLIIFLVACLVSLVTPSVSAHILLTDGSIGAVVHISPEDDPIVGENADFFFEFKDKENRFNPKNCDCRYQVLQGDKLISSGDLFAENTDPSLENASFSIIFPEKGIYTIILTGKPFTADGFPEFTLKDSVRIERLPGTSQETEIKSNFFRSHLLHFAVFGTGLGIFLMLLFFKLKKQS